MDAFLYPLDQSEPVFAQPPGHWRRRGACDTLVALASVPPGHGEREWKAKALRKSSMPKDTASLVAMGLGDSEGYTAWHYWAHGPHPERDFDRLCKLLPAGLEVVCAKNGETPCHRLLMRGADEAFLAWVKMFGIKPGKCLANSSVAGDEKIDTHWHMLAWHGGAGRVEKLAEVLDLAVIDQVDSRGLTAMMIAAHRGTRKDLEQWLILGAHPDIKDRGGNTLLHHVARYGDADWYGRMLDLGADDSIRNHRGQRARDILEDRVKHGTPKEEEILRRHWEIAYFHKTHL